MRLASLAGNWRLRLVEVQDLKLLPIVKVGSIVEDATRMGNRSGKSMEEERREAEEKVNRSDFLENFLIKPISGEEVRQGGEGEAAELEEEEEQEVNLWHPLSPGLTYYSAPFLDSVNVIPSSTYFVTTD